MLQVWVLETGGVEESGVLWAGTIPGGLFRSADGGASWQLVESLWNRPEREKWFGGGYDDPGIHSICVDPRDPRHLTVCVAQCSQGHRRVRESHLKLILEILSADVRRSHPIVPRVTNDD